MSGMDIFSFPTQPVPRYSQGKPTFAQLRARHRVFLLTIARRGRVHPQLVWRAFLNTGLTYKEALQVLNAFNVVARTYYTLRQVDMHIKE